LLLPLLLLGEPAAYPPAVSSPMTPGWSQLAPRPDLLARPADVEAGHDRAQATRRRYGL
jgi:hypothetical protein